MNAATKTCPTEPALATFQLMVKQDSGGKPLPIRGMNIITEGETLLYKPVNIPSGDRKHARVAIVLVPASISKKEPEVKVLPPKPAGAAAEWTIPAPVTAVAMVYGPQGLEAKKVASLISKNHELLGELADYAAKTETTETLIKALTQPSDAPDTSQNVDAAMHAFAAQYGVSPGKLDRSAPTDQQAMTLVRTLNPSLSAYDPLATQPTARVQQSAILAASVAGLFLGNPVGLAAGGAAVFVNLHSMMFPNSEFRSALAQPEKDDGMALCGKRESKSRTRIAYLWAMNVPNAGPPSLSLTPPINMPSGLASKVTVKPSTPLDWKYVDRARDWVLKPLSGDGKPVSVALKSVAEPHAFDIDLSKAAVTPGNYRLAGMWDWTPFTVEGDINVRAISNFQSVKPTPVSADRLIERTGWVTLDLTGADFEFVEKVDMKNPVERWAAPTVLPFTLPKGKRAGPQDHMSVDVDTRPLEHGVYLFQLAQAGGKAQDVPVRVLPPNPTLTETPVRVNLGEKQQKIVLHGTGLDRLQKVTADGAEIELLKGSADASRREAMVRLAKRTQRCQILDAMLTVENVHEPLRVPGVLEVVGPRPRIGVVQVSLPDDLTVALRSGELPAGSTVSFAMRLDHPGDQPRVKVACADHDSTLQPLKLRPGEQSGRARLGGAGNGLLFLSLDPGAIGQPGCELQATVDTDPEGRSDPKTLGKVIRLPKIESLELTGEKIDATTYVAILKGQNLETVEKTGWNSKLGLPVTSLPTPVAGEAQEQFLKIALPWPSPAPRSPLYIWVRDEEEGRATTVRY